MGDSIYSVTFQMTREMVHQWGWFLAFGIVLALLGFVAIIRSFTTTIASMMFFGWLLIFAAAVEFVDSFMVGHWAGFFLHLLLAILFMLIGILFTIRPLISAEAATFVMSLCLLAGGLYEVVASLWSHLQGWGWHVFGGIMSMLLGSLLLAQWPLAGLWAIGFFVGICLLVNGISWMAMALALRKM